VKRAKLARISRRLARAPKPSATFDLRSAGLALLLRQAIDALDDEDHRQRTELIKSGRVSGRARYIGIENLGGNDFARFEWAGKPLILIRVSILPT
jgi:hypothetical protein